MAGKLAKLAAGVLMTHYTRSKVDLGLLGDITLASGGDGLGGRRGRPANTGRHAYEIWERAGLLRVSGDELCRRVRSVLRRAGRGRLDADVAMVDFAGRRVVAATRPELGDRSVITVIGCDGSPLGRAGSRRAGAGHPRGGGAAPPGRREPGAGTPTAVLSNVDEAVPAAGTPAPPAATRSCSRPVTLACSASCGGCGPPGWQPRCCRAVSSVTLAFARLGLPWDDAVVVSRTGVTRARRLAAARTGRKGAVLTEPRVRSRQVGAAVAGWGRTLVVCERLGAPDERIVRVVPEEAAAGSGETRTSSWSWRRARPTPALPEHHPPPPHRAPLRVRPPLRPRRQHRPGWVAGGDRAPAGWALPDDAFEHRAGMLTKFEVRAVALSRLAPRLGVLVWDVGAGSGSVAVECARFGAAVVALERDPDEVPASGATPGRTAWRCGPSSARHPPRWRGCPTRIRCSSAVAAQPS